MGIRIATLLKCPWDGKIVNVNKVSWIRQMVFFFRLILGTFCSCAIIITKINAVTLIVCWSRAVFFLFIVYQYHFFRIWFGAVVHFWSNRYGSREWKKVEKKMKNELDDDNDGDNDDVTWAMQEKRIVLKAWLICRLCESHSYVHIVGRHKFSCFLSVFYISQLKYLFYHLTILYRDHTTVIVSVMTTVATTTLIRTTFVCVATFLLCNAALSFGVRFAGVFVFVREKK